MREDEFQLYADVIRSDQMPAPDVVALFKEEPEEITISNLKKFNWEYKKLPKNPYI